MHLNIVTIRFGLTCYTLASCLIAFISGTALASITSNFLYQQLGMQVATAAIVTASAALIGQLTPWIKAYFEDKQLQRQLNYRHQLTDERLASLEVRQDSLSKLMMSMRDAIHMNRVWMVSAIKKYPDLELPDQFGMREFDLMNQMSNLIPDPHKKSATEERAADTELPKKE